MTIRPIATVAFFLIMNSMVTSCSKDDKTVSPGLNAAQVKTIIIVDTWKVSHYDEAGIDHTSDFSGYAFTFNTDKTLVGTDSSATKNGTWDATAESGLVKIPIDFTPTETTGPFESISDDWFVMTASNTEITLKHTSGDDGSIDLLTFEKI